MAVEQIQSLGTQSRPQRDEQRWGTGSLPALDLRELLSILRRRKWTVIVCFVLITAGATAIVSRMTPIYEATSSVMIDVNERSVANVESILAGLPASSETIHGVVAVMLSRDFAEHVIQKLKLYEFPEFNPALRSPTTWSTYVAAARDYVKRWLGQATETAPVQMLSVEEQADRERVRVISSLLGKLAIQPRVETWVVDITVSSESPEVAALLANTIAELYLVNQLEEKFEATKRETEWLTQRLASLRTDLEQAEGAVEAYRSSAGLLEGGRDVTLSQEQISDVNSQLVTARIRRAELESRLRQAEILLASPSGANAAGDVLLSPVIQALIQQETEVLRKIAELSSTAGENLPAMQSARAEARDLRTKLTLEISRVVEGLRSETTVARAQEQTLERSLADLGSQVSNLNTKGAELRVLEREAETSRLLYEAFLSRFKEAEDQDTIQQSDARVISHADVPGGPERPKSMILIALSAAFSLLLGLGVAGLKEMFDRGLRSMEQVYRYLDMQCLGLIPAISRFRRRGLSPEAYVARMPTSAYAEAIRSVLTGILLSDARTPRVVAVTSARPNEGKTATAISMARLNALAGRRTICLDIDLRKPELHKRLKVHVQAGLVDYLSGQATLADVIQKDETTGLDYIVAGRRTVNSAELLRSKHLRDLLVELGRVYDLVIVDAPPVLALADARLTARLADKTLLVVRWGRTTPEVARLAIRQLIDAGADIAGVAISMVDVRRNAMYVNSDSEAFTGEFRRYYSG
jgi:capsular exopolysaccharide synthesis family protein